MTNESSIPSPHSVAEILTFEFGIMGGIAYARRIAAMRGRDADLYSQAAEILIGRRSLLRGYFHHPLAIEDIRQERSNCSAILRGETVNGVDLTSPGVTKHWVEQRLAVLDDLLDSADAEDALLADSMTGMTDDERDWIG